MTINEFCAFISETSKIPFEDITEESSFRDDLGIDSLSMVNLIIELTEFYQLDISSIRNSNDIATVGKMYRTLLEERV